MLKMVILCILYLTTIERKMNACFLILKTCLSAHICVGACRSLKRVTESLELGSQEVISHPMQVLEIKLEFSARAARAPNTQTSLQILKEKFKLWDLV